MYEMMVKDVMKVKGKKNVKIILIIGIIFLFILILGVAIFVQNDKKTFGLIGQVNGMPISTTLFNAQLLKQRANTYSYFQTNYGASDSAKFWITNFQGETPIEYSKKKALDQCVNIIIQQKLAMEKHIIKDNRYESFLKDLKSENIHRKEAVSRNEVIYGPVEYDEDSYFEYVFSNMVIKLKAALAADEISVSEAELKDLYEKEKETKFKKQSIKIYKISIPLSKDNNEEVRARVQEVLKRLNNGENFEDLAKEYNQDKKLSEQVFNDASRNVDVRLNSKLLSAAINLSVRQISGIIETNTSSCIIKCVEHKDDGYKTFEEVRETIRIKLIDKKYKDLIDKLVKSAVIDINKKALKTIHEN